MDTPEVPSQPDLTATVNSALGIESAPIETPQTLAPEPVEPPPFDPATITISDRLADNAPKAFEKFKNKTLSDFAVSYENVEKSFHAKAQEAAQARREAEELRMKLAAAEQMARMTQAPQQPEVPHDPWQGVNPDEAIITAPREVLNRTLSEAERRAQLSAQKAAESVRQEIYAGLQREREEQAIFQTFEVAKAKARAAGYQISDEQWKEDLKYIAPVVAREGHLFNADRYVEHLTHLKGPVKATLPREGNPPVAARPAAAPRQAVPTMSSEERQLRERLANAWGMTGEERKNYIERGGQA